MPRLTPQHWKKLDKAYRALCYIPDSKLGDSNHILYWHKNFKAIGQIRPVSLPKYNEVGIDIIQNNIRTGKMNRKELLKYL